MSVNFKYSFILALGGIGIWFNSSEAAKPTNAVDLYGESLYMERYAAGTPESLPENMIVNEGDEFVIDSVDEIEAAPADLKQSKLEKKVSAKSTKGKKSSKN